jgi:transcription elongation factor SPT5
MTRTKIEKLESADHLHSSSEEEQEVYYESESESNRHLNISTNKRRKFDSSEFLNQEAEEDDEDDDDYDYEDSEADENNLLIDEADDTFAESTDKEVMYKYMKFDNKYKEDDVDLKELAQYYKKKYSNKYSSSNLNYLPDSIDKGKVWPTLNDPKLWFIKCQVGKEKECACEIWNNYTKFKNEHDAEGVEIKSVLIKENMRGYIYIEAYKLNHVKKVIEKNKYIRNDKFYPKMVPLDEMIHVLKDTKNNNRKEITDYSLVRLKKGLYKNDLAQVLKVDLISNKALLKLIPRIDYNKNSLVLNKRPILKRKIRTEAKLFHPSLVDSQMIQKDKFSWKFARNNFDFDGYLLKKFPLNFLKTEGINPTLAEVQGLNLSNSRLFNEMEAVQKEITFRIGDKVRVKSGELANMIGQICGIHGNRIRMQTNYAQLQTEFEFIDDELEKHFDVSDHVKVVDGLNQGQTGLIVKILEPKSVVILSDLTWEELCLNTNQIELTKSYSSGVDNTGRFQIGDLVEILSQNSSIGCIVGFDSHSFRVLSIQNKILTLTANSIHLKQEQRNPPATLDSLGQVIDLNISVDIIQGVYKGFEGEVKRIYRNFVFVYSKSIPDNSGYTVCHPKHLIVKITDKRTISFQFDGSQNNHSNSSKSTLKIKKEFFGKMVKVKRGPYKNYIGLIKEVSESIARVELYSINTIINVDLSNLSLIDENKNVIDGIMNQSMLKSPRRTPSNDPQTPVYIPNTPTYECPTTPI